MNKVKLLANYLGLSRKNDHSYMRFKYRFNERYNFFSHVMNFINFEKVEGDIAEFGVFNGDSFIQLMLAYEQNNKIYFDTTRNFYGFDSFEGLPLSKFEHPRWYKGICSNIFDGIPGTPLNNPKVNYDYINKKIVDMNFVSKFELVHGWYNNILPQFKKIKKLAFAHIDCDLYESTKDVLSFLTDKIDEGTILAFDDYFHYRGNSQKGEQLALAEWTKENSIGLIHYKQYSTFCNSFIVVRNKNV